MHGSSTSVTADVRHVGECPGHGRMARTGQVSGYSRALLYPAALLTVGAAAIYYAVAPEHAEEYLPFAMFFVLVGSAQLVAALVCLRRPKRGLFLTAVCGTSGVLAV